MCLLLLSDLAVSDCIFYVALRCADFIWMCSCRTKKRNPCWSHLGALLAAKINLSFNSHCVCKKCEKRDSSGEDLSKDKGIQFLSFQINQSFEAHVYMSELCKHW